MVETFKNKLIVLKIGGTIYVVCSVLFQKIVRLYFAYFLTNLDQNYWF
jgi:hypothetical protein